MLHVLYKNETSRLLKEAALINSMITLKENIKSCVAMFGLRCIIISEKGTLCPLAEGITIEEVKRRIKQT